MRVVTAWIAILCVIGIATVVSQWWDDRERAKARKASDNNMWDVASEAQCRAEREKQLKETPPRSFGSLPSYDEFKQRAKQK